MPGAVGSHPGRAGLALEPRGDRLEDRRHPVPGRPRPAAHDRRAVPRALLAAGDAHPEVGPPGGLGLGGAPAGVVEVGVAGVDEHVVAVEQRPQRGDHLVDRIAGRDHQDDRPRRRDRRDQRLRLSVAVIRRRERARLGGEALGDPGGAVEDRDREALLGDVERERRAHRAESDQSDVRRHACIPRAARTMAGGRAEGKLPPRRMPDRPGEAGEGFPGGRAEAPCSPSCGGECSFLRHAW